MDQVEPMAGFWNWARSVRSYFRRWIYHRHIGPILGPAILFFLALFYGYVVVAVFYFFVIKLGIPPIPITARDEIFHYYGIVKGLLITHWLLLGLAGLALSYLIHLIRLFKFPRNRSKKICIGIAFSLDFVDPKDIADVIEKRKLIKRELHKLLEEKNLTRDFKIKVLNDFHANKIHRNVALGSEFNRKLLQKTRMPFIIYGFAKKASYASRQQYKYELNYIVSHPPIGWIQSLRLGRDFTRALKAQNWMFPENDAGTMIEVVADNIRQDALFSLGASAAVARQPLIGKQFLDELAAAPNLKPGFKIKIREYQSLCFYFASALNLQNNDIPAAIGNLQQAIQLKNNCYDYYINMSYLRYRNNEIEEGFAALDLAEKYQSNCLWRFNKAFLRMQKGTTQDIETAVSIYRSMNANKLSQIGVDAYAQIIQTLEEETQKNKPQFLYGLIFVYVRVKNDKTTAAGYLQMLEEAFANKAAYRFLIEDARRLLL